MMKVILFDTETTGLIKPGAVNIDEQTYIIEIFCLKVLQTPDGMEVLDEFESLIKPPVPITSEITKITGIGEDDVANKPAFPLIQKDLAEFFLGVKRVVAHNLVFDLNMLGNELIRCGKAFKFPWPIEHICTVERSIHIEQRRMSLASLYRHFMEGEFPNAHRARNDVMALFDCYKEMCKDGLI